MTPEQHMRKLRATYTVIVPETPPECVAVHDWLCSELERARIAHEKRLASAQTAFAKQRRRLAQARDAA